MRISEQITQKPEIPDFIKQFNEMPDELTHITINGAREHNLKNINLDIPRDRLIVITGLSGSGKSSLAFDTLYAEGQRRYVETMSPYAKQFLGMMKKPDVDKIEGLSPAISIEQKSISRNPRSTVGTTTEIYDYYRLLFAKIGVQFSLEHNVPVVRYSLDQIIEKIYEKYSNQKVILLAPIIKGRKGHYRELFAQLKKQGFTRVRVDGDIVDIYEGMQLERYKIHDIELVIDRFKVTQSQEHRITESVELGLSRGEGFVYLLIENENSEFDEDRFSTSYACPISGASYSEPAPNMFSFNSPYGACAKCSGIGEFKDFDKSLIIEDRTLSINEGGILPLDKDKNKWLWMQVETYAKNIGIDFDSPLQDIPEEQIDLLLNGAENNNSVEIDMKLSDNSKMKYKHKFIGIIPSLRHLYENATQSYKNFLEKFMQTHACSECGGGRLKKSSLNVRIKDLNIHQITEMDNEHAVNLFENLRKEISDRDKKIADVILKEIITRLNFLNDVGLSYLSLSRSVRTLSGGESQRIRLASQIGSQLVGIMYVLDEPSIGLHQHDNNKLINSLKKLRDLGNTVIVVEHDKAMIESSDLFIDIGPGAGIHGGEIIEVTTAGKITSKSKCNEKSLTCQYLSNVKSIEYNKERREGLGTYIELIGATGNNLKNVDLKLPLGKMVCVTGMSGSGKSSLINDTLYPILTNHFTKNSIKQPLKYKEIKGLENIDKVIEIDQAPIGRTPRSNPATYTGIFNLIRDLYAMLPESKIRGYKPGRFSFNVKGGRCEECQGAGLKKIEMNFLPDVYVTCDVCNGKRYNHETLTVKYKGKTIADVLDMTVEEAHILFKENPKLSKKIGTLEEVGLGYITLGQQAPTLSGGEAQRVKLATELSKVSTGKTLYLLDEPTTGLHFEDINILLKLINKLVDKKNTVVIIEHNLDVVKSADWIIDLGPKGGDGGGEVIATGTPEDIAKTKKSLTGLYLKEELNNA